MKLPNSVYDILKWIALVVIPAVATLYGALAPTWGWPYAEQIVYTLTAIDTFLGALLGISNLQYKNGQVVTSDEEGN